MQRLDQIKRLARDLVAPLAERIAPIRWKEFNELYYWKRRKAEEGTLSNDHYRYFYTTHFGLEDAFFDGKVILDIGCGPRGSLEWASMASRRIGLDPLVNEYFGLGADQHNMEYIDAPSEHIPLDDSACDIVCSFNSLDHVEDLDATLEEIKRVTREGGAFLLLVEVNHPPTDCEPHDIRPGALLETLKPEFHCEDASVFKPVASGVYESILAGETFPDFEQNTEEGWLSARFLRTASP